MAKRNPTKRTESLLLRIPLNLKRKLKVKAEKDGRSMNSQAIKILEKGLDNRAA